MRDVREMMPSNSAYLKKEDLTGDKLVTVREVGSAMIARQENGNKSEKRCILFFDGMEKGLMLNRTTLDAAIDMFGTHDADGWIGKQCVLYVDPKVEYPKGTRVGGLRIRKTKQQQRAELEDSDSDIPF
jgi:hypothetical protein